MTDQDQAQPVGMQILGTVMRQMRTGSGLTQEQLARKISYARSQVSNTEQGREMPSKEFLAACDEFFDTGTLFVDIRTKALADSLPTWALELQDAEARAQTIMAYQPLVVPGLLQTAAYAGAMLSAGMFGDPGEQELAERVENRLQRQRIFEKNPRPHYWVILTEAALQRVVGDRQLMRDQIAHILETMEDRKVNLQVLPCDAGPVPLTAPAIMMELEDGTALLHAEGPLGGTTTAAPDAVRECRKRYDAMRAQAASLNESACIVRARLEDLQP